MSGVDADSLEQHRDTLVVDYAKELLEHLLRCRNPDERSTRSFKVAEVQRMRGASSTEASGGNPKADDGSFHGLEVSGDDGFGTAPAPAAPPPAPDVVDPTAAAGHGLRTLAEAWPTGRAAEFRELLSDVDAVVRLWAGAGRRAAGMRAPLDALGDRRDDAVRFVSAAMYEAARAARLGDDRIDEAAFEFARFLSERLFGGPGMVFAPRVGMIATSEQEMVGTAGSSGRVRGVTFGLRTAAGAVRSKATVEPADSGRGVR